MLWLRHPPVTRIPTARAEPPRPRTPARPGSDGVRATLHLGATRAGLRVELLDWSLERARVRVASEYDPHLPVGGSAWLAVVHPGGAELRLAARLVHASEEPAARLLVFRLSTSDGAGALHPRLALLFDRRGSFRVAPDPGAPVGVTLVPRPPTRPVPEPAVVLDVSTGGLGLEVSRGFERALGGRAGVTCVLTLPGAPAPLTFAAEIVHRTLEASGRIRCGLRFDLGADRRAYDAVLGYCVGRQEEIGAAARV